MPLPRSKQHQANRSRAQKARELHAHEIPHAEDFEPDWVKDEPQKMVVLATGGNFVIPLAIVGGKDAAERYRQELQAERPIFNNLDFYYQTRGTMIRVPIQLVDGETDIPLEVHPDNHELRRMYAQHRAEQKAEAEELYKRALRTTKGGKDGSMYMQIPQDDGTLRTVTMRDGKEVEE